jgi:hypothetical protein
LLDNKCACVLLFSVACAHSLAAKDVTLSR